MNKTVAIAVGMKYWKNRVVGTDTNYGITGFTYNLFSTSADIKYIRKVIAGMKRGILKSAVRVGSMFIIDASEINRLMLPTMWSEVILTAEAFDIEIAKEVDAEVLGALYEERMYPTREQFMDSFNFGMNIMPVDRALRLMLEEKQERWAK